MIPIVVLTVHVLLMIGWIILACIIMFFRSWTSSNEMIEEEEENVVELNSNIIEIESSGDDIENKETNNENMMNVEEKVREPRVRMFFDSVDEVVKYLLEI